MIIHSDWHIHSEASYDSSLPLEKIAEGTKALGFDRYGITDHANYNDTKFLGDLRRSAEIVTEFQKTHKNVILGVELTPIGKPEFDYIQKTGTRKGHVDPDGPTPFGIELAQTKEELMALGVRYAIGAAHWRIDLPNSKKMTPILDESIREWYRQQLWMACDERVTILGHPWYHGNAIWYEDFSIIPASMNADIAAALKENGKYVECNAHFFLSKNTSEKFRRQYAEFLRSLFEMGIPVTFGSDSHDAYAKSVETVETYLAAAGFVDGDIVGLSDDVLW